VSRTRRGKTAIVVSALTAPLAAAALFASCGGTPQIEITLQDTDDKRSSAAFAEALLYATGCPALDELSSGQIGSPIKRQAVAAASAFQSIGELEPGTYGFAALLRDANCNVLASGCTTADVGSIRKVVIPVGAVVPPQGGCAGKAICVDAACVTDDGGLEGGTGSGTCPLTLVKAGKLPKLLEPGGTATGPALLASANGFLLAYREASIDTLTASATLVEISDDGTAGMPSRQSIPTCANFVADDGVALAEGQAGGLLLVSRPACADAGTGAGLTVLPFDPAALTLGAPIATSDVGATSDLALAHAVIPFDDAFQAFYIAGGTAYQARIGLDGSLVSAPAFPTGTSVFAQVAATPDLWARLGDRRFGAAGQTLFTVGPPSPIAAPMGGGGAGGAGGASGAGGAGGAGAAGGAGGGTGGSVDAGSPAQNEFTVARSLADWGAVTAWSTPSGDRAIAASLEVDGTLTWGAVDHAGLPLGTGTFGTATSSVHTATDVAVLRDHALIVVARPRGFRLWKLSGALGPSLAQDGLGIDEDNVVGTENLGNYDGARVVVAAARTRVIVAWITRKQLGTTDETGGFALYACDY
jgi:hypothetical protein